jgi:hypothetical protein
MTAYSSDHLLDCDACSGRHRRSPAARGFTPVCCRHGACYLLNPIADRIERLGISRLLATLSILVVVVVIIAVLVVLIFPMHRGTGAQDDFRPFQERMTRRWRPVWLRLLRRCKCGGGAISTSTAGGGDTSASDVGLPAYERRCTPEGAVRRPIALQATGGR